MHPTDYKKLVVSTNAWLAPDYSGNRICPCTSTDGGLTWQCESSGILAASWGDPAAAIASSGRVYTQFIDNAVIPRNQALAVSSTGVPGTWSAAPFPGIADPKGQLDKGHLWIDNTQVPALLHSAWSIDCVDPSCHETEPVIEYRGAPDVPPLPWVPTPYGRIISDVSTRHTGDNDRGVNLQTGPSNHVYACWGNGATIYFTRLGFARSDNDGANWPVKKYITQVIYGGNLTTMTVSAPGSGALQGGKTAIAISFPTMAVDPSTGQIFLVWGNAQPPVSGFPNDHVDIYMIRSPDQGATWYGPTRVNQGIESDQWNPWVTFDTTTGSLVVVYYDSRNDPAAAEVYASISRDAGATWTDVRLSDGGPGGIPSSSASQSGGGNEYLGVAARAGVAYPVWTDDRDRVPGANCPPPLPCGGGIRPWKVYASPLLLGGIDANSISVTIWQYCVGPFNRRIRVDANWDTIVAMDGDDKFTVTPPSGAPYVAQASSQGTSHSFMVDDLPCVNGEWTIAIESAKGAAVTRATVVRQVNCASCPPPCDPPCELD